MSGDVTWVLVSAWEGGLVGRFDVTVMVAWGVGRGGVVPRVWPWEASSRALVAAPLMSACE